MTQAAVTGARQIHGRRAGGSYPRGPLRTQRERVSMARLVIFDDRVRGMELPGRPVLIGRSRKNDLPINDGLLSRKHCSVVPMGTGYRLMDLKSSNGTYLNGKRIEKVDLHVDDIIEIGHTVIVFLEDGVWSRGEGL